MLKLFERILGFSLCLFLVLPGCLCVSFAERTSPEESARSLEQTVRDLEDAVRRLSGESVQTQLERTAAELDALMESLKTAEPRARTLAETGRSPAEAGGTVFLSEVRGEAYPEADAVPDRVSYAYLRPSDGAVFAGTLRVYALRADACEAGTEYRGYYEGVLTFDGFAW